MRTTDIRYGRCQHEKHGHPVGLFYPRRRRCRCCSCRGFSCNTAYAGSCVFFFADSFMRRYLRKGVPSLGADLFSVFEEAPGVAEAAAGDGEEEALGRPSPVVTDAVDLRNHPVQQMVMELTKRWVGRGVGWTTYSNARGAKPVPQGLLSSPPPPSPSGALSEKHCAVSLFLWKDAWVVRGQRVKVGSQPHMIPPVFPASLHARNQSPPARLPVCCCLRFHVLRTAFMLRVTLTNERDWMGPSPPAAANPPYPPSVPASPIISWPGRGCSAAETASSSLFGRRGGSLSARGAARRGRKSPRRRWRGRSSCAPSWRRRRASCRRHATLLMCVRPRSSRKGGGVGGSLCGEGACGLYFFC